MIQDFLIVLMTNNLPQQRHFYNDILGLDLLFDNTDTVGLGKQSQLFIVLREDNAKDSHHRSEQKGPQIMTFKCKGDIHDYAKKVSTSGFKVRDRLAIPEQRSQYLFIEDYDGNEICLDCPLA